MSQHVQLPLRAPETSRAVASTGRKDTNLNYERGLGGPPRRREAVQELLRCCGTQFDEELVEAFVRSLKTLGDPRMRTIFDKVAG